MNENKPKILLISSVGPTLNGGSLTMTYVRAFREQGYDIDLLIPYKADGYPEILYTSEKDTFWHRKRNKFVYNRIKVKDRTKGFVHRYDNDPYIATEKVLRPIQKPYDIVLVLFTYRMLSPYTIEAIHKKTGAQIQLLNPDYALMTGGCHFFGDCDNYTRGCGNCPALAKPAPDDFTRSNAEYRRKMFLEIKPIVWGNSFINEIFERSTVFGPLEKGVLFPIMDETFFKPIQDRAKVLAECGIEASRYDFIMFWGCQQLNEERKGAKYLFEALKCFRQSLSDEQASRVLVMVAGSRGDDVAQKIPFDVAHQGYVSIERLAQLYAAADVYLSPSVNDPGPSMVNQSILCGTPVVAFQMGVALDIIKDKGTGYCATMRDSEDFARGISMIYNLDAQSRVIMREKCREIGVMTCGRKAVVDKIVETWQSHKS